MASPFKKTSSLPGRILARFFLMFFGFALGIALFTPWNKLWSSALASLDERLPTVGLRWDSIDKDGPFGFRVRELKVTLADTPGNLAFHQAYVSIGFSPLAKVRLDTGSSECELNLFQNGTFDFEGDLNLTALLGGADLKGILHVAGNLFMPEGAILPRNGWVDIRSQHLILPDEKVVEDLAFTSEIKGQDMTIRDFSMGKPLSVKASGRGLLNPVDLYQTSFDLKGQMTVGKKTFPYDMKGSLADAVW
ncbi:hypothetical protein [Pseudodesulfovibrio piezophilus]|uniref:Type II secretion system protein N n=1 Tax=Pseudodesulfovibrio piezophilus (strain DSM 21447 / JCM 15486 / C1TLV30) TaxID=1322246 RepID=M1WWZ6_PSEP2|nr:hypothetical protein [Pseudodesulfovibrio piezophilus]CCH49408.1 conserved protein of unknown function [Pseudodesulfovibrio piezophilus C1TLV30]